MQSPGSQGTRDASTPEIEEVFSLAADPQLAENSRQESERKNRAFALGFEELKSQTMQWGSWQASAGNASVPTVYLYNGPDIRANVIEEVDNGGNVLARYTQGQGVDRPLAELRSGTTSYYEQDGLSSVSSLSSTAGALAKTYTYDSFGKLTASTGTLTNPFQYTGRESDPETNLDYYRYRYYDPSSGRFLSEDLITFEGGIDFYEYVRNHPLNFVDPFGLAGKQGPPPPPVRNPIPNAIAAAYAAYLKCANSIGFKKQCDRMPAMPKVEAPPDGGGEPGPGDFGVTPGEGNLDPNETLGDPDDTLDKLCDCLKENPLAALNRRFNFKPKNRLGPGCMVDLF